MGGEGYGVCGPGYVGEEDVESWAGGTEYWEGEKGEGDREQADMLDDDEAKGLGFLDDMGDIPPDERDHRLEETTGAEIDLAM